VLAVLQAFVYVDEMCDDDVFGVNSVMNVTLMHTQLIA